MPTPSSAGAPWTATDAADFTFNRIVTDGATGNPAPGKPSGTRPDPPPGGSAEGIHLRAAIARAIDGYAGLFTDLLQGLATDLADELAGRIEESTGHRPPEPVVLVGEPGHRTGAFVWIHNPSRGFVPELRLRLTDLWHADGSRLRAESGGIEPSLLAGSAAARRSAWVDLDVPERVVRGSYHGHVLADGLPDVAVALKLIVR